MIKIIHDVYEDYSRVKVQIGADVFDSSDERIIVSAKGQKLFILDRETSRKAASQLLSEIDAGIKDLELFPQYSFIPDPFYQDVSLKRDPSGELSISWDMKFYLSEWREPYTARNYIEEFSRRLDENGISWELPDSQLGFSIPFIVQDVDSSIREELYKHAQDVREIHDETIRCLKLACQGQSLSMLFDFPEAVSVPCEQYLLYFAQFLKDLGVQAQTALTHEAGQVLFTVTPSDENEALDNIRSALDIYLNLPSSPVSDTTNDSIAVQRLEVNILRLRSDLKLAAAELQAKDISIEAQNLIIQVQKGMLSGEILADSMKNVTPKPEDKEHLINGVVALSTYKEKGVEINLGEILRRLKKAFAKKDK